MEKKKFLSPDNIPTRSEKDRIQDEIASLPEVVLTEKLDSGDLDEIRRNFYPPDTDHGKIVHEMGFRKEDGSGIPLTEDQFADAVLEAVGNKEYEIAARKLFDKLTEEGHITCGVIWWDTLLEAIIRGSAEAQLMGAPPSKRVKEKQNLLVRPCKSPIVRVILVETPHSACYLVVSKMGSVGIYGKHMDVKVKYTVPMGKYKTINCCWVTDAVYAAEANGIIIATSTRNLYFYNSSQIVHKLLFVVMGIDNIPCCLHYCPLTNKEAVLTIGDDKGVITSLRFHQPAKSFLQPQPEKEATSYYWLQLKTQKPWVDIVTSGVVHGGGVNMVEYIPENKSIVSCSSDPKSALIMRHQDGKQSSYIFVVAKGVRRFRLDKRIGQLVTVSGDYSIKLWNPVVINGPIEELEGHVSPVADVAILKHIRSIISISEDAVLKVWDLESHSCVQTLHLHFPGLVESKESSATPVHLYPGLRYLANTEETINKEVSQPAGNKPLENNEISQSFKKDIWSRCEVVVTYGKYLKVLELDNIRGQSVEPLPLPRRNLEPAIPTPYYPLTHTHRENTKILKQKMFKNLAGLAPFHENSSASKFDPQHEFNDDVKMTKMLVKNGVPHLALSLCKIKPLPRTFFRIVDFE